MRPLTVAVVHGGPGAAGEMAPVAQELSDSWGVVEPLQTAPSLEGQVEELRQVLVGRSSSPVTLIGFSWGALLSYLVAAHYPSLVGKLILVGSGPFDERYAAQIEQTRLRRLDAEGREAWQTLCKALNDPVAQDRNALMKEIFRLAHHTDTYDSLVTADDALYNIRLDGNAFKQVWQVAAEWRKSGILKVMGANIRCPVVAVHGDYDPHPAAGVREPLSQVLTDFRFVLLDNCGHTPWYERQAKDKFFQIIRRELS